jgi:hypothetical protein
MAPHKSSKCCELTALKEWRKAHLKNDRLCRLQDMRHSLGLGDTENTGKGSTTTMPVPALQDAPRRSLKHRISVTQLTELRNRMAGYREEECLRNLQKEQELQDALANTECDAETAGESSMWTPQDSTEAGVPPVTVTVPPPQASDNVQQPGPTNSNPTELEVALAIPNLCPEDRAFVKRAIFKSTKKMVPGNAMTARYVPALLCGHRTNVFAGDSALTTGVQGTRTGLKASSNTTGKHSTTSLWGYVPVVGAFLLTLLDTPIHRNTRPLRRPKRMW